MMLQQSRLVRTGTSSKAKRSTQLASVGRVGPISHAAFKSLKAGHVQRLVNSDVRIQRNVTASAATASPFGTLAVLGSASPSSVPVVVIGAQGTQGAAVAKALLEAGFKVTAGVDFPEQAKATVAFAKKYELLNKSQLANLKLAEDSDDLPPRSKVVIIENDVVGDKKVDAKYVKTALERAEAADAAQVILISTNTAPAGGLFGFGSDLKSPNKSLTAVERLVAGSGLPITIVRVNASESALPEGAVKVAAGPGSLAPVSAPVTPDQLQEVLSAVLTQSPAAAGVQVVLEAAAVGPGEAGPVKTAVASTVSEIKANAPPPPPPPVKKPVAGTAKVAVREEPKGTAKVARSPSPAPVVRKATPPPPAPVARRATPPAPAPVKATPKPTPKPTPAPVRVAPAKPVSKRIVDDDDEEEKEAKPSFFASLFGGGTGTTKVKAAPPPPAKSAPARGGTSSVRAGTTSVSRSVAPSTTKIAVKAATPAPAKATNTTVVKRTPAPAPAPVRKPAVSSRSPSPPVERPTPSSGGGLFGFFAINPSSSSSSSEDKKPAPSKAVRASAPPPRAVAKPAPAPAKPAPKPAPAKPVARAGTTTTRGRAADPEPVVAKPSGGGLFGLFGFGGKPKVDDDEDDVPVKPAARKAAPPPARAAPASKSAPAPAKAASPAPATRFNPFAPQPKKETTPSAPSKAAPPAKAGTQKSGTQSVKPGTQSVSRSGTQSSRTGTQSSKTGTQSGSTLIRGTYKPVSGFSVEPKKK